MKSKREFTEFLDEEIARLGRQRQQLIDLRQLYEPKEEVLPEAPAVMAVSTEDMIVRVVENAEWKLSREGIREAVQQDYGVIPEDFDAVLEQALQRATRIQMTGEGIGLVARSAAALRPMRKALNFTTGRETTQTENKLLFRRAAPNEWTWAAGQEPNASFFIFDVVRPTTPVCFWLSSPAYPPQVRSGGLALAGMLTPDSPALVLSSLRAGRDELSKIFISCDLVLADRHNALQRRPSACHAPHGSYTRVPPCSEIGTSVRRQGRMPAFALNDVG